MNTVNPISQNTNSSIPHITQISPQFVNNIAFSDLISLFLNVTQVSSNLKINENDIQPQTRGKNTQISQTNTEQNEVRPENSSEAKDSRNGEIEYKKVRQEQTYEKQSTQENYDVNEPNKDLKTEYVPSEEVTNLVQQPLPVSNDKMSETNITTSEININPLMQNEKNQENNGQAQNLNQIFAPQNFSDEKFTPTKNQNSQFTNISNYQMQESDKNFPNDKILIEIKPGEMQSVKTGYDESKPVVKLLINQMSENTPDEFQMNSLQNSKSSVNLEFVSVNNALLTENNVSVLQKQTGVIEKPQNVEPISSNSKQIENSLITKNQEPQLQRARQEELIQRIANFTKFSLSKCLSKIKMVLNPPDLGKLNIDMTLRDGVLSANMKTETNAAKVLILENINLLKHSLENQGVQIGTFNVYHENNNYNFQNHNSHYENNRYSSYNEYFSENSKVNSNYSLQTYFPGTRFVNVLV